MNCICGGHTIVKDGRSIPEGYWRRRKCIACGAESTTIEQLCQTVKGNRVKAPVVNIPVFTRVDRPKRERKKKEPVVPVHTSPAWARIEDMKLQKELEKL